VAEATDDKTLPKADRKRLQIEHAHHISSDAVLAKLEDESVVSTGQKRTQWRAAKDDARPPRIWTHIPTASQRITERYPFSNRLAQSVACPTNPLRPF
jgi:hypothetical protein